ncbi:hypothetical protein HOM50_00140 [bacterium]|jgi:hypothetical protein|nr:hypothetical protein [bacterium]MBT5014805.1 hypothetical protein [bacterium]
MKPNAIKGILAILLILSGTSLGKTPQLLGTQSIGDQTVYAYQKNGSSKLYAMDNVPYALCSKALCTIDPNNPKMSICICPIYGLKTDPAWQRISVGPKSLKQTQPTYSQNGQLKTVVSNYSIANTTPDVKHDLSAPATACLFKTKTPWANCFGIRCKVQYQADGSPQAICQCPLVKSSTFVSVGPKNTSECQQPSDKAWSAASTGQGPDNNYILREVYKKNS